MDTSCQKKPENENKKVSIVIPVYNVSAYLPQCLDSVIHQTYTNLEIILTDDGSTDQSGKICDEYAEKDKRIKVIHQANQGAACAKNTGLDNVTGDYVTFIDSDDYAELNWIGTMVRTLEENDADVVECNFVKEYIDRTEPGNMDSFKEETFNAEQYMYHYLDYWTNSLFWNKLFKRELTDDIRFRYERRCIDDEFYTYKAITRADRIIRIENVLIHYRQRRSSAVFNDKNKLQITDDAMEILIERYKWISKYFPFLASNYLKHDVLMLYYIGRQFSFDDTARKKFYNIAWYYLKESLKKSAGICTYKTALSNCLTSSRKLIKHNAENNQTRLDDYYL